MNRTVLAATTAAAFSIAAVVNVAQITPSTDALPSGINAPGPSPPAGPPPDAAAIARGTVLYETTFNCAACHGLTGRGGPNNSLDLTKSALAMQSDAGRGLAAFLRAGRPDRGMPALPAPLTDAQAADLSAKLRSLGFAAAPQVPLAGRGPEGPSGRGNATPLHPALAGQQLSILVGDPALGQKFFKGAVGQCSSCHSVVDGQASPAVNLARVAQKYRDPKALQNAMLLNRGLYWSPRTNKDVTATITYADGRSTKGYLTSVSDFKVVVRGEDGTETEIVRKGGEPKVVLTDRLQHHLDLLETYTDNDIHNLTAYLATLR